MIYKKGFLKNAKAIRNWLDENIEMGKGREFILELDDFILTKISPHPTHYPEWKWKRTSDKLYRRALFKKYIIVFKYFPNQIEILAIYHQRKDASKMEV